MDDLEQQLKEIREDLDQKYLKYLEFKKQLQQNEFTSDTIDTIDWEMEKINHDMYNDIHNDIHNNIQTMFKTKSTLSPQTEIKIPIIKETYYDRYNKKNIPKIPRKSIYQ